MTPTGRDKPPQISLPVAEILYIAMDHVLEHVEGMDDALVENMHQGDEDVKTYSKYRTAVLAKRGNGSDAAREYTDIARGALNRWLGTRATKRQAMQGDFDQWARELNDDE